MLTLECTPMRQMRWGHKPDGVCLVVGACNRGHDPATNATGDLIYTTEVCWTAACPPATHCKRCLSSRAVRQCHVLVFPMCGTAASSEEARRVAIRSDQAC